MPRVVPIGADQTDFSTTLTKALQSCHINILLGSGASTPAIPIAGTIEQELNAILDNEPAFQLKKFEFVRGLQASTNNLIGGTESAHDQNTLECYGRFLILLSRILEERKTDLLPRQATIFTTNYDLFIERAAEDIATLRVNDGFLRGPSVGAAFRFQPEIFFDVTYKTGPLFKYSAAIPIVNLVKLHGSLSWRTEGNGLVYGVTKRAIPDPEKDCFKECLPKFIDDLSLVLPTKEKFKQTVIERTYFDLLRIFANALEVENTILISFGFSFEDEHICDLVIKALRNPTLLLVVVAYSSGSVERYKMKFAQHSNVVIYHPEAGGHIEFQVLNKLLSGIVPKAAYGD